MCVTKSPKVTRVVILASVAELSSPTSAHPLPSNEFFPQSPNQSCPPPYPHHSPTSAPPGVLHPPLPDPGDAAAGSLSPFQVVGQLQGAHHPPLSLSGLDAAGRQRQGAEALSCPCCSQDGRREPAELLGSFCSLLPSLSVRMTSGYYGGRERERALPTAALIGHSTPGGGKARQTANQRGFPLRQGSNK